MVMKMNKHGFIEELVKETGYDKEKCILINDAFDENFLFGKNNQQKTIKNIMTNLNCDEEEATKIHDIALSIIKREIKDKIKHPFKK